MLYSTFSPKTKELGDEIVGLNLLEMMELATYLRDVHGITVLVKPVSEQRRQEPTDYFAYDVVLLSFEPNSKIPVIKEVRSITGMGLKETKDFVEAASLLSPKVVKSDLSLHEAQSMVRQLEVSGARVVIKKAFEYVSGPGPY